MITLTKRLPNITIPTKTSLPINKKLSRTFFKNFTLQRLTPDQVENYSQAARILAKESYPLLSDTSEVINYIKQPYREMGLITQRDSILASGFLNRDRKKLEGIILDEAPCLFKYGHFNFSGLELKQDYQELTQLVSLRCNDSDLFFPDIRDLIKQFKKFAFQLEPDAERALKTVAYSWNWAFSGTLKHYSFAKKAIGSQSVGDFVLLTPQQLIENHIEFCKQRLIIAARFNLNITAGLNSFLDALNEEDVKDIDLIPLDYLVRPFFLEISEGTSKIKMEVLKKFSWSRDLEDRPVSPLAFIEEANIDHLKSDQGYRDQHALVYEFFEKLMDEILTIDGKHVRTLEYPGDEELIMGLIEKSDDWMASDKIDNDFARFDELKLR